MKHGLASAEGSRRAIAVMERLNRRAASHLTDFDIGAVTDITGFGLLGHLREVSRGSGLSMRVSSSDVPIIDEAARLVGEGMVPGGSRNNEALVADICDWSPEVTSVTRALLCDAQTSGGLLISVRSDQAAALVSALREDDCPETAVVGKVLALAAGEVRIFVEP